MNYFGGEASDDNSEVGSKPVSFDFLDRFVGLGDPDDPAPGDLQNNVPPQGRRS